MTICTWKNTSTVLCVQSLCLHTVTCCYWNKLNQRNVFCSNQDLCHALWNLLHGWLELYFPTLSKQHPFLTSLNCYQSCSHQLTICSCWCCCSCNVSWAMVLSRLLSSILSTCTSLISSSIWKHTETQCTAHAPPRLKKKKNTKTNLWCGGIGCLHRNIWWGTCVLKLQTNIPRCEQVGMDTHAASRINVNCLKHSSKAKFHYAWIILFFSKYTLLALSCQPPVPNTWGSVAVDVVNMHFFQRVQRCAHFPYSLNDSMTDVLLQEQVWMYMKKVL